MKKESFTSQDRIRKSRDYSEIHSKGKRYYSKNFIILLHRNESGTPRLGTTVGKKIGKAVTRNRIKRLLREFFRLNKDKLIPGHDMVIIVRKDVSSLKYQDICRELERFLSMKPAGQ